MLYSYVITRDYGFAPNPFGGYCTLATCKPRIRKAAQVGDWLIGTGSNSVKNNFGNRLIYAMQVDEKMSFTDYWNNERFQHKKPVMNGSKRQKYGDNIYRFDEELSRLVQLNSHHSLEDGSTNEKNYAKDTSGKYVLVSKHFWYFGEKAPLIPDNIKADIVKIGINHKTVANEAVINSFKAWLSSTYEAGYIGEPCLFRGLFERYDGN